MMGYTNFIERKEKNKQKVMTVREKLNEKDFRINVLSVGLEFDGYDFIEIIEEEFVLIPSELLDREVIEVREFDTPTYVELVLKDKENR